MSMFNPDTFATSLHRSQQHHADPVPEGEYVAILGKAQGPPVLRHEGSRRRVHVAGHQL